MGKAYHNRDPSEGHMYVGTYVRMYVCTYVRMPCEDHMYIMRDCVTKTDKDLRTKYPLMEGSYGERSPTYVHT